MLKFSLRKNTLHPESNNYVARVENLASWGFDDLKAEVTRSGSILKNIETKAVMEEFFNVVAQALNKGIAFHSSYFSVVPSIKGTFDHALEPFDPSRHEIVVNMIPGPALRSAMQKVAPERISPDQRLPQPIDLFDNNTEQLNQTLSPGHVMELSGERIKVNNPDDPAQGIFLIKTDDGETFRVPQLKVNTASSLVFKAPIDLIPGTYRLEVRTNFGTTEDTLRAGEHKSELEV